MTATGFTLKRVRDMIRTYILSNARQVLTTQLNHLASLAK